MNWQWMLFFSSFVAIYGLANYYVGRRGWQVFHDWLAFLGGRSYALLFLMLALSYLFGRFFSRYLPESVGHTLTLIGSYWMAAIYYLTLLLLLTDFIRWMDKIWPFLPSRLRLTPVETGVFILLSTLIILACGSWNAANPVWRHYEVSVAKPAGGLEQMKIVMVSDIHLGPVIHNDRLNTLVEEINSRQPDIVLLVGDIIDEDLGFFIKQEMGESLKNLKSSHGTFAVMGNHEYISGQSEAVVESLRNSGVVVLRDGWFRVGDHFTIAGRDDVTRIRATGRPRGELKDILKGIDRKLPVILMDHQPLSFDASLEQGVDLQLSGHTHRGQLFPNNFITSWIYELDSGYLKKGNLQVIVSTGFGTWGPPVRTSARPEMVEIVITFKADQMEKQ